MAPDPPIRTTKTQHPTPSKPKKHSATPPSRDLPSTRAVSAPRPHHLKPTSHPPDALKKYAPRLYAVLRDNLRTLCDKYPDLKPNWRDSVYSTVAFNLGRNVTCLFHRDSKDLAYSLCAIHALGEFDHTKGGHLALKEPKLILQFPPGSLILIPSSVITHGNTPIQPGENRQSMTQYMMAGIVRFVDNKFRHLNDLKINKKAMYKKARQEDKNRWINGIALWPTPQEIA